MTACQTRRWRRRSRRGWLGRGRRGRGRGGTAPGETGRGEAGRTGRAGAGTAGAGPAMPRLTGALEPRGRWQATACSLARAIDVVSPRSAFLLLREACYGTTRFDDFAARAGISEPGAAGRLRG